MQAARQRSREQLAADVLHDAGAEGALHRARRKAAPRADPSVRTRKWAWRSAAACLSMHTPLLSTLMKCKTCQQLACSMLMLPSWMPARLMGAACREDKALPSSQSGVCKQWQNKRAVAQLLARPGMQACRHVGCLLPPPTHAVNDACCRAAWSQQIHCCTWKLARSMTDDSRPPARSLHGE